MNPLHVDFTTGSDTGDTDSAAIAPIQNLEPASAAVFQRPSENLRTRSETARSVLEELRYLEACDRWLLLTGGGNITWEGVTPDAGTSLGRMIIDSALVVKPALAPATNIPATLLVNGGLSLQTRVAVSGGVNPVRAYGRLGDLTIPGADQLSFEVVATAGATKNLSYTGNYRHWKLVVDPTNDTFTTVKNYLDNTGAGADQAARLAFQAIFESPAVTAGFESSFVLAASRAYLNGALDAEQHIISAGVLAAFFAASASNRMVEGDTLCIIYSELKKTTDGTAGGRRQSLLGSVESDSANLTSSSLALLRNAPFYTAYAIPIATVVGGNLALLDGTVLLPAGTGVVATRGSRGDAYPAVQRWAAPSGNRVLSQGTTQLAQFTFKTSYANQIVELDVNLQGQLSADVTGVAIAYALDGASLPSYTANIGSVSASTDPDNPDVPFNDNPWIPVGAPGLHTILVTFTFTGAGSITIKNSTSGGIPNSASRITLS